MGTTKLPTRLPHHQPRRLPCASHVSMPSSLKVVRYAWVRPLRAVARSAAESSPLENLGSCQLSSTQRAAPVLTLGRLPALCQLSWWSRFGADYSQIALPDMSLPLSCSALDISSKEDASRGTALHLNRRPGIKSSTARNIFRSSRRGSCGLSPLESPVTHNKRECGCLCWVKVKRPWQFHESLCTLTWARCRLAKVAVVYCQMLRFLAFVL